MKQDLYNRALGASSLDEFTECFQQGCTRCTLSNYSNKGPIVYRGNPRADIMLIAESPGLEEEKLHKPLVGPAGKLLTAIMNAIDLNDNEDMFLSNSCFCRYTAPKGSGKQNLTPKANQYIMCRPFVYKLIRLINPKIIIACGRTALAQLTTDDTVKLGQWAGRWTYFTRQELVGRTPMFVMHHPAWLIHLEKKVGRQEYIKAKRQVWEYMKYFRDTYKEKL